MAMPSQTKGADYSIGSWTLLDVAIVPASDKVALCLNSTCDSDINAVCFPDEDMWAGVQLGYSNCYTLRRLFLH